MGFAERLCLARSECFGHISSTGVGSSSGAGEPSLMSTTRGARGVPGRLRVKWLQVQGAPRGPSIPGRLRSCLHALARSFMSVMTPVHDHSPARVGGKDLPPGAEDRPGAPRRGRTAGGDWLARGGAEEPGSGRPGAPGIPVRNSVRHSDDVEES